MLWDGYTDCITKGGAREMKSSRSIIHYSLFAALIGMTPMCADAGLRVGNHSRSYAEAYQQVNALQNSDINAVTTPIATTASEDTENNLPVRVADETLVEQIKSGDADAPVAFNQLEQCSMIYPTGEFEWDSPSLGSKAGISDTCVAVVELRGYQAAADGSDLVLARAKLAAGDTFKCNISSFPESSMIVQAVESFTFPADAEPTMEDVEKQLNQEQKQNAGLKIAAGTVLGALAGNIVGEGERGSDSLFGTGKEKIQSSIIGGVTGAALMAGNSYAGKVAGDVILSTGVNAAAGSVVGNIVATGDSVLRIEDCKLPTGENTTCLWGYVAESTPLTPDEQAYYDISNAVTYVCNKNSTGCKAETLVSIKLDAYPNIDIESIEEQQFQTILSDSKYQYFMAINDKNEVSFVPAGGSTENVDTSKGIFAKVSSAARVDRQIPAMIKMKDKAFGMNSSDWREWKKKYGATAEIYGRSTTGDAYDLQNSTGLDIQNFYPMKVEASDGGLIDYGNKARLKSTLIGAGVGGALGGFSAYQGAQLDIQNRWTTAVREYEDSLNKVYCATGTRYLSKYNDTVFIPNMTTTE